MTPPISTGRSSSGDSSTARTASASDWLDHARLFHDSENTEDPAHFAQRWDSDQSFRTSHPALFLALNALETFFGGTAETLSATQSQTIREWVSQENPDELDRLVLANLRELLASEEAASDPRTGRILEIIGRPPAPEVAPDSSSDSFTFSSLSFGFRFDRPHRDLANAITAGALPSEGLPGYNQTADFGWQFDAEFQWGNFRFFAGVAWNHGVAPVAAPEARFEQGFFQLGLVEYGQLIAGNPAEGFFLGRGRSRVGVGIGVRACTGFSDATAAAGATCPDATPQLELVGDSDLISVGYGPVELSIRLLHNPTYFNLSDSILPSMGNLVPLEYSLMYHFNQPDRSNASAASITDAQALYDGLRILTGAFQDNLSFRSEAALEETRILNILGASGTVGAEGQYNLLNLGTFVGGVLRGVPAGTLAHEVRRDLEVGTTEQRVILSVPLALEPLIHGLIAAGSSRDDPNLPSLEEQAFYLSLPYMLTRDSLSIFGALGAFGSADRARSGDLLSQIHFFGSHGVMALGGLFLILASGDGSGNSFLANSILGNRRPALVDTEIAGTQWDLPAQREQYWRLNLGSMFLTYGAAAILDYILGSGSSGTEAETDEPAVEPTASLPFRIGIDTDGLTRGTVSVSGEF